MEIKILLANENILAVEKPCGILLYSETENQLSLMSELIKALPELKNVGEPPRYGLIHRLDKETSGIVLVAKNNETLKMMQEKFKKGEIKKEYIALVFGNIKQKSGVIKCFMARSKADRRKQRCYEIPMKGSVRYRFSETYYEILKRFKYGENVLTMIKAVPKTGRKHQIRCHMAFIGHAIVGDKLYGFKNMRKINKEVKRSMLHAHKISFEFQDKKIEIVSPLPTDFMEFTKNLEDFDN